jgi:alanyl-tRNA synthetase
VGRDDIPAAIERLQSEAKSSVKERQKLREDLAGYHAVRLAVEEMIRDNLRLVRRVFTDRDREYVRLLASRLTATVPQTVALFISAESDPARIFLARSQDMQLHCGEVLREALAAYGLRGGGSSDLAQGDLTKEQAAELSAKLTADLRSLLARPHPTE